MDSSEIENNQKNLKFFIIKYIFRLIHIVSFAFIFGNVSYDLFISRRVPINSQTSTSLQVEKQNKIYFGLTVAFYVLIILSGLINMIILVIEKKFVKDRNYNLWKYLLVIKTFVTIFLTPILDYFIELTTDEESAFTIALKIRFSFLLILTLISPFLRFLREYYLLSGDKGEIKNNK